MSPVIVASGALIVAAAAGIGWLALRGEPSPSPPPRVPLRAASTEGPRAGAPGEDRGAQGRRAPPSPASAARSPGSPPSGPLAAPREAADDATAREVEPAGPAGGAGEPDEGPPDARSGLAAFPPPGSKPIQRGLVVPDGYELPPGYVRHYQATDDGQMLPPVLRFHPDHQPLDASGKPIAMPPGRLVPPELAPPGMPREVLDVPATPPGPADRK